eukprot:CAMPEP_0195289606 /NCGR_PEP_ID=MMETSP0707-20130614/5814_1 /TAXON_ID=33640 /ORGANISM="Asterionellopsis glacialis, Strain CCMP134" /LENGTH=247 /DNA_ID=CAMNT_0040349629 /DNA_START=46 /DNA_END=786 /DNA_ORIENTATION=+
MTRTMSIREDEAWYKMFHQLEEYKRKYGSCKVPNCRTRKKFSELSDWVKKQRKERYSMPRKNRRQLDKLDFNWSSFQEESVNDLWYANFERLRTFQEENGHSQVPRYYKEDTKLGPWVSKQRCNRNKMSPERKRLLDGIGFVWQVTKRDTWDEMFERLVQYKERTGNCDVPQIYKPDQKLGSWVSTQRHMKHKIPSDRAMLLDTIGFKWQRNTAWDDMFDRLKAFYQENGHCLVPNNYKEDPKLGRW